MFVVDLDGDLDGEEGPAGDMFARMASSFGYADASTQVRGDGWEIWTTS